MTWTHFNDMHSGGGCKLEWEHIFIEAPEDEAKAVFFNRFHRSPDRVTCTCCGSDYSISEDATLEQATAYQRNCEFAYFRPDGSECSQDEAWKSGKGTTKGYSSGYVERQRERLMDIRRSCTTAPDDSWGLYVSLADAIASGSLGGDKFLIIRADEIKDSERTADIPEQGYVWKD